MRKVGILVVLFSFAAGASAEWHAYRIHASNPNEVQRVADSALLLLSERVAWTTDVAADGTAELQKLRLPFTDLGPIPNPMTPYVRETDGDDYKTEYLRYDEIIAQYEEWRLAYPSLISREQVGVGHEGRAVWVYRLRNPQSPFPQTGVFIQGGIHAREWISPPVCMYLFEQLLTEALTSAAGWELISRFELIVVPVLNPDGYEYSHTNVRLWRKNRRNNGSNFGVDLNRNYSIGWGGEGSSGSPGSSLYRGPAPFSEPELSGLKAFLDAYSKSTPIVYAIDYHSYGQLILYPLGWIKQPAPDQPALHALGAAYRSAVLASGGVTYFLGQSATSQYVAGGTAEDFHYDAYDALSYTLELRPTGSPGFELPPSQILPTIRENWAGFRAALDHLLK